MARSELARSDIFERLLESLKLERGIAGTISRLNMIGANLASPTDIEILQHLQLDQTNISDKLQELVRGR